MRRDILRKKLEFVCILLVLTVWGAQPSQAYQQEVTKLATELGARIQTTGHTRVTVVDFVDIDGKPNKLGKFLAQQLQLALAEPERKLVVIDQSHLPQLFDQMKLLSEGLIDPETGRKLGKIAGTEVLVVGTVMPSSMTIRVDAKAIDLQTANMIAGKSINPPRMGMLSKLANESAKDDPEIASDSEEDGSTQKASKSSASKAPRAPARSRPDQGVLFELDGCSLSGDALTCSVIVTSERDRWLALSFDSRAWTEEGEEFGPGEAMIANSRTSASGHSCAVKQVLKNVPTRLSLTFPQFGDSASLVERFRLFWQEAERCCCFDYRPINFEKIALSDDVDYSSSQASNRSGKGRGNAVEGTSKGKGGLLNRLTGKALGIIEDAATKALEKETRKVLGDDDEEEERDPPQK